MPQYTRRARSGTALQSAWCRYSTGTCSGVWTAWYAASAQHCDRMSCCNAAQMNSGASPGRWECSRRWISCVNKCVE